MADRFAEIARRKQALIERCAQDREELGACLERVRLPLNAGTLLVMLGRTLRAFPLTTAGLSSLLVSGYGARLTRSAGTVFKLARAVTPLAAWWSKHRRGK